MAMENGILHEGLWTYSQSLTSTHLEAAIGALTEAGRLRLSNADVGHAKKEHHKSVSAILHSYSALECALSLIGHEIFVDPESKRYILPQERDVGTDMLAKGWFRTVPVADKLRFVLLRGDRSMPSKLESQLREFGNLRNWVAHGFVYKTTLLLSRKDDKSSFDVVDQEDSIDWGTRFPNTKFRAIHGLQYEDGITALGIVFASLREIAAVTGDVFWAVNYYGAEIKICQITKVDEEVDIAGLIERNVSGAPDNRGT
jgi:hypothetical protein